MAQQTLNIGSGANQGDGDTLRAAMIKVNENFTEIYASPLFNDGVVIDGNEIRANRSNDDLLFSPSGTGSVTFPSFRFNDNNIEGIRSNEDINLLPSGTGSVVFGAIKINGTSLSSDDSSLININDALNIDGDLTTEGTGTVTGAVTLSSTLSVEEATTTLSTLNVTGTATFAGSVGIQNLSFQDNIISTASNADLELTPGGTGSVVMSNLTVDDNINITDNEIKATASNSDLIINASGTGNIILGAITINGTSLSASDSSTININEGLVVDGTASVSGAVTLSSTLEVGSNLTTTGNVTVNGTTSLAGTVTVDSLTFSGNVIGSSSNADIEITPGGTGTVQISNLTIDGDINVTDNIIKTTQSNSPLQISGSGTGTVELLSDLTTAAVTTVGDVDITGTETITGQLDVDSVRIKDNTITTNASNANLEISANGTGNVIIDDIDINGGTIDNAVIGGTTPAAGTFTTLSTTTSVTIDGVTISDNTISTNASNAPLELSGSGTGGVRISGFTFPTTDGTNGEFLKTNGSGILSFASAGASLSHSVLADATTSIASSATSNLDTFAKATYRSAKYFISAVDATNGRHEIVEANVTHDGTNAYIATFGSTSSSATGLSTYSADIDGDNVRVRVTNISDNTTVFKFQRIVINV